MSKFKFEKQFRAENPQTIGETDKHYDLENYKEWLESKTEVLIQALEKIVNAPQPHNDFEHQVFVDEATRLAETALSFYNAT